MMRVLHALLVSSLLIVATAPAVSVEPDEMLDDPALEHRARALSAELRCMVCQNQTIDESNAPLARDLRILVRQRLEAGDSDAEVLDYLVARYGEFVLLKPRVSGRTIVLWSAPFAVLAGGLALLWAYLRKRAATPGEPRLSEDEARELQRILAERGGGNRA